MASRQKMAVDLGGADIVVDPSKENLEERIMDLTGGLGVSLIVECSGSRQGISSTVDVIGVDGRIVLTGQSMGVKVPIEIGKTIWKHASIVGSCGSPYFFLATITYMSRGLVDFRKMVTDRFPLTEALAAFKKGKKAESGKIMVIP